MATYYVKNGGNDGLSGTSDANAWATIAKVNGTAFNPGDSILFNRGDIWREQLTVPSSGSSGNEITFGAYGTGDLPVISGADVVSGFADQGGNVWRASCTETSRMVFFQDGVDFTWGDRKTALGSLANEYDFYLSGTYLYVYAASDPDSRYTNVLVGSRDDCVIGNSTDYIIFEDIEVRCTGNISDGGHGGIRLEVGCSYWIIQDCHIHHHGSISSLDASQIGNCIMSFGADYLYVRRCDLHDSGRHIIFLYSSSGTCANNYIYENKMYNCSHNHMDVHDGGGTYNGIYIYRNDIYQEASFSYLSGLIYLSQGCNNVYVYYNLIHDSTASGVRCAYDGDGPVYIYGNTFYNNNDYHIWVYPTNAHAWVVKNNIFCQCGITPVRIDSTANWDVDYNCYYQTANANIFRVGGTTYTVWATFRTATGFESNGMQDNPDLTNPAAGDFTLLGASPCIDQGVNLGATFDDGLDPDSTWPDGVLTLDQDLCGTGWEIGAYVYPGSVSSSSSASSSSQSASSSSTSSQSQSFSSSSMCTISYVYPTPKYPPRYRGDLETVRRQSEELAQYLSRTLYSISVILADLENRISRLE